MFPQTFTISTQKMTSPLFSKNQIAPNFANEAGRNRYIFLPSMFANRSLHFGRLIARLSLTGCTAVNINRMSVFSSTKRYQIRVKNLMCIVS